MELVLTSERRGFNATLSVKQAAVNAVRLLQQQSLSLNNDKMTLNEINREIKMTRQQMNK